jgi:hypothetical protein
VKAFRRWLPILVLAWFCAVGVGARAIYAYSTSPGPQRAAPKRWPSESPLATQSNRLTIVMFVHPECPCSRASLTELEAIADRAGDRAAIHVVFSGIGETWEQAASIPGANRIVDPLRAEAARFGAVTSGHVVVYDARGAQRYAGGITGSRGHVGDNVGRKTVEDLLAGSTDVELGRPVFGCGL